MPTPPRHCRPEAYHLLAEQLPRLESTDGLLHAAVAVSMHELDDVSPHAIDHELSLYARAVRDRVRGDSPEALLAHLHDVLFDVSGFSGNVENYYSPLNSYLPAILASRRGLPITLALLYKVVAERAGLRVVGINAPLHFMAGVEANGKTLLVDPFFGGRALSRDEAFSRIEEAAGQPVPRIDEVLPVATHRQWLTRILNNLVHVFQHNQQELELDAMLEMRALLDGAA